MLTVITCCVYLTSSFTSHEPLDQWCSSTTRLCQDVEVLESTTPSNGLGGRATPSVARIRVIWDKYFGMNVFHACTIASEKSPCFRCAVKTLRFTPPHSASSQISSSL